MKRLVQFFILFLGISFFVYLNNDLPYFRPVTSFLVTSFHSISRSLSYKNAAIHYLDAMDTMDYVDVTLREDMNLFLRNNQRNDRPFRDLLMRQKGSLVLLNEVFDLVYSDFNFGLKSPPYPKAPLLRKMNDIGLMLLCQAKLYVLDRNVDAALDMNLKVWTLSNHLIQDASGKVIAYELRQFVIFNLTSLFNQGLMTSQMCGTLLSYFDAGFNYAFDPRLFLEDERRSVTRHLTALQKRIQVVYDAESIYDLRMLQEAIRHGSHSEFDRLFGLLYRFLETKDDSYLIQYHFELTSLRYQSEKSPYYYRNSQALFSFLESQLSSLLALKLQKDYALFGTFVGQCIAVTLFDKELHFILKNYYKIEESKQSLIFLARYYID